MSYPPPSSPTGSGGASTAEEQEESFITSSFFLSSGSSSRTPYQAFRARPRSRRWSYLKTNRTSFVSMSIHLVLFFKGFTADQRDNLVGFSTNSIRLFLRHERPHSPCRICRDTAPHIDCKMVHHSVNQHLQTSDICKPIPHLCFTPLMMRDKAIVALQLR